MKGKVNRMTDQWIIAICVLALPLYMCSGIILNRIERSKEDLKEKEYLRKKEEDLERWREYK